MVQAPESRATTTTTGVTLNLPWVEKYRPDDLNDIVSHTEIITTIKKFVAANKVPHLLLYGPPGTGKTTTVLAIAHQMYTRKQFPSMVLELNASDDRGIDVVRESTRTLHVDKDAQTHHKLVILDEADAMTKDAQNALRRVIEKFTENARFAIICNYANSIIPALQLDYVAGAESVPLTDDGRQALLQISDGDMRRILNVLQSATMASRERANSDVDAEAVYACIGQPTPKEIDTIVRLLMDERLEKICTELEKSLRERGYALSDVVSRVHNVMLDIEMPDEPLAQLVDGLSEIERRLAGGSGDAMQIGALAALFVRCRHLLTQDGRRAMEQ